jgi:hypothetical protein
MNLKNDQELSNTEKKLVMLNEQIELAKARPASAANTLSLRSLVQMANQLREEIVRYRSSKQRRAS